MQLIRYCLVPLILSISIAVSGQPDANFTSNITSGCGTAIVSFSDQSTGGITSWSWNFGDGGTSTFQNPTHAYTTCNVYTVTLTVTNGIGQTDTYTATNYITVFCVPVADFSAFPMVGCLPLTTCFTNLSTTTGGAINYWNWIFGDGSPPQTGLDPCHTYLLTGTYTVTLDVRDVNGCTDSETKNFLIDVDNPPVAAFSGDALEGCLLPHEVVFSNPSTGNGITFEWDFGDGNTSTDTTPVHSYTNYGNYTVSLIVTNANGCTDTLIFTDYIRLTKYENNITVVDADGCVPFNASFSDTASSATVWAWTFGDTGTSTANDPSHNYTLDGTYTVSLISSNALGCSDTSIVTDMITVFPLPVVDFVADSVLACDFPFCVQFTNLSTPAGVYWAWSFGDGSTTTAQNPQHCYNALGIYNVRLTVHDANGCINDLLRPGYIKVSKPNSNFSATPLMGCAPLEVDFTDLSTSFFNIDSWEWNYCDGGSDTVQNPTHIFNDTTPCWVSLKVCTDVGCCDERIRPNYISPGLKPTPDFYSEDTIGCHKFVVQFHDSTEYWVDTWLWDFGDNGTSTTSDPEHTYEEVDSFDVQIIVGHHGCFDTLIKPYFIHVWPPKPEFSAIPTIICEYESHTVDFTDESILADTWLWDFGDGVGTSTAQNPSYTYTGPGFYTVKLTVTNANGCIDSLDKASFIRISNIEPGFYQDTAFACVLNAVTFHDTSTCNTSIVSQNWDFGDGDFGTGANPSHNYLINAELDISLIVTDQLGCKDTISKTRNLTVHQRPSPRFVADTTYGCKPFTVQFTDLSIPRDSAFLTDWLWNFGDGQTSTDQDPLHVYANRGAYTVILTVTNSHGCDSTWVINNYITPTFPYPSYSFPSPVCHYDSVHFINSSTGGGLAYQWDFGDLSPIYTTTSPYHDFDPDTTMWYYLSLLATDTNGCDSTLIDSIRISRPIAYFYADSVESECPPFGGQFRDSSTADVISWSWNFGDIMSGTANTSANADPYHIYYSAGKYDVQLVIINNDGCRDTLREMDFIYVHGPSGTFDFNPKVGCAPLTVTFVATTQNAAEYQWVFDDGNAITTSADTITYTYSDGKNYIPVLVMTDSLDGPLDSILCSVALIPDTNLIVISGGAMFFADTNLLCSPDSIHFTDTSFASSNSYINAWSWQFGDMLTDVVPDPAHFYAAPGLFDVTLTVTIDSCVYSYTFDDYIRVSGLTGDFSFAPTYSCEPPLNVNFTSTATEADHYAWSFGDASSGSGQNISHIYQAGHFDPLLVIQDTITYNGDTVVCYDSIGSPITIDVLDGYVDFAVDTTYSCYPSTFFFADSSLYNDTIDAWNWHFGDGDSSMIQDPSHFYANTGYFTVTLTVTIDSCIYDSTRINYVQVYDPPDILFSLSDTANCYPLIVFFDIIDSTVTDSVISWFWSFGDGFGDTIMEPTHIYDTTNTYNIVVTATLWNQCLYAYSQTRDLIVFPLPVADFISNHDIYLTRRVVKFTNQSQPADSIVGYYWEFGDGENDNVVNPEHEYNYVGEYDVMLVVLTGDGCVDTVYKTVDVIPREDIPNAFTPNGDGINDVFLDGFQLTILNRWGQVLYEGTDGWDGTYNGQAVSKGTYFFIVLLDEVQDAFQKIHGSVTIVDN